MFFLIRWLVVKQILPRAVLHGPTFEETGIKGERSLNNKITLERIASRTMANSLGVIGIERNSN